MGIRESKELQGEGDYKAARRYREAVEGFTKTKDVRRAAREAAPASLAEDAVLKDAEKSGRKRSKGEDDIDVMAEEERSKVEDEDKLEDEEDEEDR